ncbi:hypothetical protein RclHR1_17900007 [Rhizophagus clarus]|uniref:DUF6570 domain-containing protein n=1 Tax=Rhizophagus clarus TaxID=94130 RepID=A0A2Z6QMM2_9GLOM|nr:hypothetical protein RclHR1_17900007 [Rhizophagus clarus]
MHKICPACNERFSSINLILGMCCQCYSNKNEVKKFSAANNMDLDNVPEELKSLTEIEEMLISQIFLIVSVYYLRGGQYAYSGNFINFPQDRGSLYLSFPEILQCWIHLLSVINLLKLKENNRYYSDIIIDDDILYTLPEDSSIDEYLLKIHDAENRLQLVKDKICNTDYLDGETDDTIIRNFILASISSRNENCIINDALTHMQSESGPVMWLNIGGTAINEFNTPGYIARAFPTLYPTSSADLQADHVRDINPAKYF